MSKLVVITLPSVSGLPKDAFVNTFAVKDGGLENATEQQAMMQAFVNLFVQAGGNGTNNELGAYISPEVSRASGACSVKLYDITNKTQRTQDGTLPSGKPRYVLPSHGSPLQTLPFTMGSATTGTSYPSQIACAVTLEAAGRAVQSVESDGGTVRERQRYTGRVYLGPLTSFAGTGTGPVRPSAPFMADVAFCFNRMEEAIKAAANTYELAVWSRADGVLRTVRGVSVDNRFDVIRKRGSAATSRTRTAVRTDLAA